MKRCISALVLAVALAAAGPAAAHPTTTPAQRTALMLGVAAKYWGAESTCPSSGVTVVWQSAMPVDPDTGTTAGGEAIVGGCALGEPTISLLAFGRPPLSVRCTVIVHEYGHLVGLNHDAGGVMDPSFITTGGTLAPCRRLARRLGA